MYSHGQTTFDVSKFKKSDFMLLELLVVVANIGLLATYLGPRYFAQIGKLEITAARAQIDALPKLLDTYHLDAGRYPTTEQGLNALLVKLNNELKWNGPYLQQAVPDLPWSHPYIHPLPQENEPFEVISYGKGDAPCSTGEITDTTN